MEFIPVMCPTKRQLPNGRVRVTLPTYPAMQRRVPTWPSGAGRAEAQEEAAGLASGRSWLHLTPLESQAAYQIVVIAIGVSICINVDPATGVLVLSGLLACFPAAHSIVAFTREFRANRQAAPGRHRLVAERRTTKMGFSGTSLVLRARILAAS